ncbi:DUF4290 domain-containing protein [Myroides sp. WP-1]|uniref:DUF4290 domain-containing protein n=1 Tax=Myroides sp. WP-1 TaxID=2759944 RepID=UPI0015FDD0FD|nr:DUF4290 domain-containing protein [Myroides sp. WP-1]MBB1139691.1 DUF4290 domain-containing protein [Myroides sp. WP-1]
MKFNSAEAVTHLGYNTASNKLVIPDYGRHLQLMIEHIMSIENREERNKAANFAIRIMGDMNPHLRDVPDFQHKLWDQLFMISDFKLDVDCPFPIATRETVYAKPEVLPYPKKQLNYRYYGNNIKSMIAEALKFEEGEMKDALIIVIANHMKKSYLSWNKDNVKDEVIFEHLSELSGGKINLSKQEEELSTTANLIQVNRKQSNKSNYSNNTNANNNNQKNNNNNNKKYNKHNFQAKGKKQ